MDNSKRKQGVHSRAAHKQIFQTFLVQAAVTLLLGAGLLLVGRVEAWSAVLGGGIYLIPNIYFAWRVLARREGQTARSVLAQMYVSEIWKMAMSILLFAAVFILVRPLSPFSLFGTFILLQLIGWVAQMKANNRFLKL